MTDRRNTAESVNHRVLRSVVSILLGVAVMGLVSYEFGRATRTEWVWWLAPLTVAFDATLLFRSLLCGAALLRPWGRCIVRDPAPSIYLLSSALAASAAFTGNRLAIIVGAAFAVLGSTLQRGEDAEFGRDTRDG